MRVVLCGGGVLVVGLSCWAHARASHTVLTHVRQRGEEAAGGTQLLSEEGASGFLWWCGVCVCVCVFWLTSHEASLCVNAQQQHLYNKTLFDNPVFTPSRPACGLTTHGVLASICRTPHVHVHVAPLLTVAPPPP